MISLRSLLPSLIIGLLALLSAWLYQQVQLDRGQSDGKSRHDPDAFVDDFDLSTLNAAGRLAHRLWAKRMDHYPDNDSTLLTEPYLELYRAQAKPMQARAMKGNISAGGAEVVLEQQVNIHRPASRQQAAADLRTEKLRIFPDRDFAETDAAVSYQSAGLKIQAIGMRAYLDKGQVELLNRVRAVQQPQGRP